jgi:alkylation response protein AidB-like acyl-CoA dehydrogenase
VTWASIRPATASGQAGGLAAAVWGLTHERLSVAAQVVGSTSRTVAPAAEHLRTRRQFGRPLTEHQALRLRLAEPSSRLTVLRFSVWTAAQGMAAGACGAREAVGRAAGSDEAVVVTHGLVITLWRARLAGRAPDEAEWRTLRFPDLLAFPAAGVRAWLAGARPAPGDLPQPLDDDRSELP